LNAYGESLAINSAYREFHRSPHHQQWTWQTKSKNALLIDGLGQKAQDKKATGKITRFETAPRYVWTTGDATVAYQAGAKDPGKIRRVTRDLVFVDQRYVVLRDRVELAAPGTLSWLLHAEKNLLWDETNCTAVIRGDKAALTAQLVAPAVRWRGAVTDQFPVPVDPKYVEGEAGSSYVTAKWTDQQHLTVESAEPATEFTVFAVLWPERHSPAPVHAALQDGRLRVRRPDGQTDLITLTDTSLAVGADALQQALDTPIVSVVDKKQPSPTGDPHDYVSYGRYWWPDPARTNGLPFIRRDGHPNREQMALGDQYRLWQMIETVETLAQAWQRDHCTNCATRAGDWIRAWFVSPATRMNPSFDYAQIRLGHNHNRGSASGLIDTRGFVRLVESLRRLDGSPALTAEDETQLRGWFADYLHWLTTSDNGRQERAAGNNHGTWLLAQLIAISHYLGRDDEARAFAREDFARIEKQFAPDGSQPLEIAREDGLGYCAFNLEAQFTVARLAAPLGVDLWNYTAPNGASLRRGLEFLRPYNAAPETWPHKQWKKLEPGFLDSLLEQAARVWGNSAGQTAAPMPAATPLTLPGAETFVYRDPMRLHVFKPKDWKAGDRRPAFVFFFGGGWTRGTPERSAGYARWAATLGMVGIAPDYRTRERFGTTPLESVADGRAAVRWIEDHADELGVDPARLVVGGSSAGGHVALWTAITHTPPGSAADEAPRRKPVALVLLSPVSDTSMLAGYTPQRFGEHAEALSPLHQLDAKMPAVLVFHGDADTTVPQRQSIALREKLVAAGTVCELVRVPGGGHGFSTQMPQWRQKVRDAVKEFLTRQGVLPVAAR
jgi:acetyl esterase/lipase